MAVQRSLIDPLCSGDFTENVEPIRAVIRERAEFLERGGAEQNFSYKQIIPYVILRHGEKYLLIKRLPKQGEKRLHNKFSLGVGGHINVFDQAQSDILEAGMQREKNEEIKIEQEGECRLIGVINTDVAEVDRVHLGVVYIQTCLGPPSPTWSHKPTKPNGNPRSKSLKNTRAWSPGRRLFLII